MHIIVDNFKGLEEFVVQISMWLHVLSILQRVCILDGCVIVQWVSGTVQAMPAGSVQLGLRPYIPSTH